ncbi:MAG: lysostaphin resistance A-like protein [Eubacterium sp.]
MPQYYYDPFNNGNNQGYAYNEQVQRMYEREMRKKAEKRELRKVGLALGTAIIAYIVLQSVASILLMKLGMYNLYKESAVFQYAFNIIFVSVLSVAAPFGVVALFNRKKYRDPIVPNKPIKASKCFAWVCFGMCCCIVVNMAVNYIVTFLKTAFNITLTQGESLSPDSVFACVMEVIALAVIPALCEEFAMRCCSLQLLKKYGTGFAIFAVSMVFGLLHGNVIQFLFAFAVGAVLAYVTVKTGSIIPAILIHMLNNGMSAVQDIFEYSLGEKASDYAIVVMFIFWVIAGVLAAVYLFFKKEFNGITNSSKSVLSNGEKLVAFLFPGMIIPFAFLIAMTAQTVSIG